MIAIDTEVMIWGIKKQASDNRRHMLARAAAWLASLHDERICIPAQVLAEFLVGYTDEERTAQLQVLAQSRTLFIAPLDAKAAYFAAELTDNKQTLKQITDELGLTRQVIKADINVVAIAISAGASQIISEDDGVLAIARLSGRIRAERLPTAPQ